MSSPRDLIYRLEAPRKSPKGVIEDFTQVIKALLAIRSSTPEGHAARNEAVRHMVEKLQKRAQATSTPQMLSSSSKNSRTPTNQGVTCITTPWTSSLPQPSAPTPEASTNTTEALVIPPDQNPS